MEDNLIALFCLVDDFYKELRPVWEEYLIRSGLNKIIRQTKLNTSEIITIYIHFHQSRYRDFKSYYLYYVKTYLTHLFPNLLSYTRFVTLIKSVLVPLCSFLQTLTGEKTGIYFIDSTIINLN